MCGVLQTLKYRLRQIPRSVEHPSSGRLNLADSTTSFASRMEDNSSTDRVKDADR